MEFLVVIWNEMTSLRFFKSYLIFFQMFLFVSKFQKLLLFYKEINCKLKGKRFIHFFRTFRFK
ncbi:hypothetical protein O3G_MSEX010689 [Manduca sexta]|uniref:Uncharacterized protein n=1 Tax=Manduca sexta TaxID=7130 RepID=A0A921ZHW0_MANSE|nr:hypothetical protein O3G_MSEX010689 [Manduca sexta]KAG6458130.1 hypothetical protein O3G_MSEX010689 [Manduca sexta]